MNKLKHLKTFESFEFESKGVDRKEMIDMLSKDKECKHSKKDLENMSDKELEKMCHKMEGFKIPFLGAKKKDHMRDLKEELEFLASHKDGEKVKELYKDYKETKDQIKLRHSNHLIRKYAVGELDKTEYAARDFQKNVYRIIDDRVEELGDKPIGGRGAASAST